MDPDSKSELVSDARAFARRQVARGDKAFAEILEDAVEYFLEEYEDAETKVVESVCDAEIAQAFAAHIAEQATWPETTDCDRLDQAFETLNAGGIIAAQDFTCCQTCGLAEIGEPIQEAINDGVDVSGFAFYHAQDTDAAVEGHGLYLTYGHVDGGETNGVAIGRIVADTIQDAGLETDWDGTMGTRIFVRLNWQRRLDPELAQRDP